MIRFLFRWLYRGLLLAIVLATALVLVKDTLLREWILYRVPRVTGLETRLESAETRLFTGTLSLTGLQIFNSADFGGTPLLHLPELHLELDREALRYRELRFRLARVHVAEFNVVRNQRGETNLFALWRQVNERATAADAVTLSPPGLEFTGIETLNLTVGTVRFVDLGQPANSRELRVALTNEVLQNVKSTADFTPLLLRLLVRELGAGLGSGLLTPPRR